jgi:hypothetical protein
MTRLSLFVAVLAIISTAVASPLPPVEINDANAADCHEWTFEDTIDGMPYSKHNACPTPARAENEDVTLEERQLIVPDLVPLAENRRLITEEAYNDTCPQLRKGEFNPVVGPWYCHLSLEELREIFNLPPRNIDIAIFHKPTTNDGEHEKRQYGPKPTPQEYLDNCGIGIEEFPPGTVPQWPWYCHYAPDDPMVFGPHHYPYCSGGGTREVCFDDWQ